MKSLVDQQEEAEGENQQFIEKAETFRSQLDNEKDESNVLMLLQSIQDEEGLAQKYQSVKGSVNASFPDTSTNNQLHLALQDTKDNTQTEQNIRAIFDQTNSNLMSENNGKQVTILQNQSLYRNQFDILSSTYGENTNKTPLILKAHNQSFASYVPGQILSTIKQEPGTDQKETGIRSTQKKSFHQGKIYLDVKDQDDNDDDLLERNLLNQISKNQQSDDEANIQEKQNIPTNHRFMSMKFRTDTIADLFKVQEPYQENNEENVFVLQSLHQQLEIPVSPEKRKKLSEIRTPLGNITDITKQNLDDIDPRIETLPSAAILSQEQALEQNNRKAKLRNTMNSGSQLSKLFKKRTPPGFNFQKSVQEKLSKQNQKRSVSAQPANSKSIKQSKSLRGNQNFLNSQSRLNKSTIGNMIYQTRQQRPTVSFLYSASSQRSNSTTSEFIHQKNRIKHQNSKSVNSQKSSSILKSVGNQIINSNNDNQTYRSIASREQITSRQQIDNDHQNFFNKFECGTTIQNDEFQVKATAFNTPIDNQRIFHQQRSQTRQDKSNQLLDNLAQRYDQQQNKIAAVKIQQQQYEKAQVNSQKKMLKKLLTFARDQHKGNDEAKILELMNNLKAHNKPISSSKIKVLQTLELYNSPYEEQLTRMIKDTTQNCQNSNKKKYTQKQREQIKRNKERLKKLNEQKISQIAGVYGGIRRAKSSKINLKKMNAMNLEVGLNNKDRAFSSNQKQESRSYRKHLRL